MEESRQRVAQIRQNRASLGHSYFLTGNTAMMLETEVFEIEPDITVVSCAGRFTLGTQLRLTESMINTLLQKGSRKLIVDLTHAELVDSAGLGVLMHVFGEMEQIGGTMRVAGANERVANMFHVTHTDGILAVDADLMASVKKLKGDEGER
jgi:anti-sigma B factor antagonist